MGWEVGEWGGGKEFFRLTIFCGPNTFYTGSVFYGKLLQEISHNQNAALIGCRSSSYVIVAVRQVKFVSQSAQRSDHDMKSRAYREISLSCCKNMEGRSYVL